MIKTVLEWKEKFYKPVKDAKQWTDKHCFQHTLKKYLGVAKEARKKFGPNLIFVTSTISKLT